MAVTAKAGIGTYNGSLVNGSVTTTADHTIAASGAEVGNILVSQSGTITLGTPAAGLGPYRLIAGAANLDIEIAVGSGVTLVLYALDGGASSVTAGKGLTWKTKDPGYMIEIMGVTTTLWVVTNSNISIDEVTREA